jgi:hypothetical protein
MPFFLIKYLVILGYDVTPPLRGLWKDNSVLQIKIYDPESKQKVIILDSLNFFPTSLKNLLISFNCNIRKGEFPHLFVRKDNLNYIGDKPESKYYGLSLSNGNGEEISLSNIDNSGQGLNNPHDVGEEKWNLKEECLKYLKSDVEGLFEIIDNASKHYFDNYKLNMSSFLTLPSLSLGIFGNLFFNNEKYRIKMIKGPLEKYLRESYYGGNVQSFVTENNGEVEEAFHYDLNSQYPNAMVSNEMPVGNPVFSTNKNIDYYSGFVYAKIIPPSEDKLKNLYIQYRGNDPKNTITCPRTPFIRWIDSLELKSALKEGYKAEIICGIDFPDSKKIESRNLFTDFVDHFFNEKLYAKDQVARTIAKLILNSLYGKFGQKDISSRIRIVDQDTANKLVKKYHYTYFSEITKDKILIKYSYKLNEKLRRLYEEDEEDIKNEEIEYFSKERGIPSAVHISSRIAALARVSINIYKNIPGNRLLYSDTDSLFLEKPLPDYLIGKELGKWKLEAHIKKGVFIRPKVYYYEDVNNNLKKVCAGVNAESLSINDYKKLGKGEEIQVTMPPKKNYNRMV